MDYWLPIISIGLACFSLGFSIGAERGKNEERERAKRDAEGTR